MTPDEARLRKFDLVRKGCNPVSVQRFQEEVADELRNWEKRVADLEVQCAELIESMPDASEVEAEAKAAEAWRDEVLADLNRRRVDLNAEIVRMRAGRDVLQKAIEETLGVLEAPLGKLVSALKEARFQGNLEADRVREARRPNPEEMRAELEAARLAGFVPLLQTKDASPGGLSPEPMKRSASPQVQSPSPKPSLKPLEGKLQDGHPSPDLPLAPLAPRPEPPPPAALTPLPGPATPKPTPTPTPPEPPSPPLSPPPASEPPTPPPEPPEPPGPPPQADDTDSAEKETPVAAANLDQLFARAREELDEGGEPAEQARGS